MSMSLLDQVFAPKEIRSYRKILLRNALESFPPALANGHHSSICKNGANFDFVPFSYGAGMPYRGKSTILYFYLVRVLGDLPWAKQVPNPRFAKGVYSGESRWIKSLSGGKHLDCYKYGITKYENPLLRKPEFYDSVIKQIALPRELGQQVEGVFQSLIRLQFPGSVSGLSCGNYIDGTWEGVDESFNGYSELFNFLPEPSHLVTAMDRSVEIVSTILQYGDEGSFDRLQRTFELVGRCLQFIVDRRIAVLGHERFRGYIELSPWFDQNVQTNKIKVNVRRGRWDLPDGVGEEEVINWALSMMPGTLVKDSDLESFLSLHKKHGFNRFASEVFVRRILSRAKALEQEF